MTVVPSYLPPLLQVTGTQKCIDLCYQLFCTDFKESDVFHFGKKVAFSDYMKPGETKEELFWHVITREKYDGTVRPWDQQRAERLPWARPLTIKGIHNELVIFDYIEGPADKGSRRYVWIRDHSYVVIFQNKKKCFQWITAFYVDEGKKVDLERKLAEASKLDSCLSPAK